MLKLCFLSLMPLFRHNKFFNVNFPLILNVCMVFLDILKTAFYYFLEFFKLGILHVREVLKHIENLLNNSTIKPVHHLFKDIGIVVKEDIKHSVFKPVPLHLDLFKLIHKPEICKNKVFFRVVEPVIFPCACKYILRDPDEYIRVLLCAGNNPVYEKVYCFILMCPEQYINYILVYPNRCFKKKFKEH